MTIIAKKSRRLVPLRPAGFFTLNAPFWRGERAEYLVAARTLAYAEEKEQKAAARRAKRAAKNPGEPDKPRERRPRSPNAELTRLERNLKRRKTLAARQRIEQQIKELKRQLEGAARS